VQIKHDIEDLCRALGKESVALVEAFGIPEHLLAAPIASDWVKYNVVDNQGELTGSLW
jgi:acyl-CoA oxidase